MIKSFFSRISKRLLPIYTFSRSGLSWRDGVKLAWAGVARGRPFKGPSFYAKCGRIFGSSVVPQFKSAPGSKVHLDLSDLVDLMIAEEIFVDGIYPLQSLTFTPDTVIDCGACAGMFTLLAKAQYPDAEFHLFEPEPANIARIGRNLNLNAFDVTLHELAVGTRAGRVRFSGEGFGGRITDYNTEGIEVEVSDFPAWLSAIDTARLLLKIDIEGAEAELLPALPALLPQSTALFLETHHDEETYLTYLQAWFDAGFTHTVVRKRPATKTEPDYVEHLLVRT